MPIEWMESAVSNGQTIHQEHRQIMCSCSATIQGSTGIGSGIFLMLTKTLRHVGDGEIERENGNEFRHIFFVVKNELELKMG